MTAIVIGRVTTFLTFPQITYNPEPAYITAISNAVNAEVTTSTEHGFEDGMVVKFYVNSNYGMEINNYQGKITLLDATNFTIPLDTRFLDPFVVPSEEQAFPAQVVPVTGTLYNTYEQN